MPVKKNENPYQWEPVFHTVFKDKELAQKIHERGYAVLPLLNDETMSQLQEIYQADHDLNVDNGGMFYTMYSKDMDYRLRIHNSIKEVLKPVLEAHFENHKNVVNSFVVKSSGEESEFYVHQDTTALDEFKYSPLSLWIPLHEINETNGALTVIEKTQWFFSPYRGVSFGFPFKGIINTVRKYLKPVYMKPGEVLVFDPRIIHNSMLNKSGKDRVAIICGVFNKEAEFVTCFKDPSSDSNPIELYRHDDEYPLKYPNFFYDCHVRPVSGEKFKEAEDKFPQMEAEQFESLCDDNGIEPINFLEVDSGINCNMIAEPDGINKFDPVPEPVVEKKSGLFSWFKR